MSADNGVYVLATRLPPTRDGAWYINRDGYEYRVAHCQAIDNIEYSDLYLAVYFGMSEVLTKEAAFTLAGKLAESIVSDGVLEYGIQFLARDVYFPNITPRAAQVALDCYVGAVPLDVQDG